MQLCLISFVVVLNNRRSLKPFSLTEKHHRIFVSVVRIFRNFLFFERQPQFVRYSFLEEVYEQDKM